MHSALNQPDWAKRLADRLRDLDEVYSVRLGLDAGVSKFTQEQEEARGIIGTVDPSEYPQLAAFAVSAVVDALSELPNFDEGRGLIILDHLRAALTALHDGNILPLVMPSAGVGADNVVQNAYKANVFLCVRLLEIAGARPTPAIAQIVKQLNVAGHRWKKRRLSQSSVTRWHGQLSGTYDPPMALYWRESVNRRLKEMEKARPVWPPSREDAEAYVRAFIAGQPFMSLALRT